MLTLFVVGYLILTALTAVGYWKSYAREGVLRNKTMGLVIFVTLFAPLCGMYWLLSVTLALAFFITLRSEALLQRILLDPIFGRRRPTAHQRAMSLTRQQLRKMEREKTKALRRSSRARAA